MSTETGQEAPPRDGKKETYRFKDLTAFRLALDDAPPDGWVKKRSLGGERFSEYLPVSIIEALADIMFREWTVIEEKPLNTGNGIGFTIKIQALPDYPGADYIFFTGSGAVPFQDTKNAVEYNFPSARTRAITTAFGELGNIFGRNIGRKVDNVAVGNGFTLKNKEKQPKDGL